jgi:SAM-dependent methyltransferase
MLSLYDQFGSIDIYLFDQLLKGNILPHHKILDAGCGYGRNAAYFIKNNYDICGIDNNPEALLQFKQSLADNAANMSKQFIQGTIEKMPFASNSFDWVICNAVLHFAQNQTHFEAMLLGLWNVLKPGGRLFIRLASSIGIESKLKAIEAGRYWLPDGSIRFLVNYPMLGYYSNFLDAQLFEPIKTINVQELRCMTTWCLQKKENKGIE